jgi:hypothetical protein
MPQVEHPLVLPHDSHAPHDSHGRHAVQLQRSQRSRRHHAQDEPEQQLVQPVAPAVANAKATRSRSFFIVDFSITKRKPMLDELWAKQLYTTVNDVQPRPPGFFATRPVKMQRLHVE